MQRIGDLEIDEDAGFAERGWRFQQAGWLLMLLFAACALLGLTGSGPFARATATADHFRLKYDRFDRTTTSSSLILQFDPVVVQNGMIHVWLKRDYLDSFVIESVAPEPESVASSADRLIYTFRAAEDHPGEIKFHLKADPRAFGLVQGEAGVMPQGQVSFRQFLYP